MSNLCYFVFVFFIIIKGKANCVRLRMNYSSIIYWFLFSFFHINLFLNFAIFRICWYQFKIHMLMKLLCFLVYHFTYKIWFLLYLYFNEYDSKIYYTWIMFTFSAHVSSRHTSSCYWIENNRYIVILYHSMESWRAKRKKEYDVCI